MIPPLHVLFVCTANICRSAYSDVRAQSMLGDKHSVSFASAGTWGFDAAPMDAEMANQALARGLDASTFRSRRLDRAMVEGADLILTASSEHRAFILEDWPGALRKTFTLGQFAKALNAVDAHLHGRDLIEAVRARRVPPGPELDIPDPYRKGSAAAAACAQRIDDLLTQVVPRLAG